MIVFSEEIIAALKEMLNIFVNKCDCDNCNKERRTLRHKINSGMKRACNCKACRFESCSFGFNEKILGTGKSITIKVPK